MPPSAHFRTPFRRDAISARRAAASQGKPGCGLAPVVCESKDMIGSTRAFVATFAIVAAACTSGTTGRAVAPQTPVAVRAPPKVEDYPDANIRALRRMASEPRPVEPSAIPPRHLDAEKFPRSLVERTRIVYGGQPPDGIPAIDRPRFASAEAVDWLEDQEPVLILQIRRAVRIYPVQVMMWHEIVNDRVAGVPVVVTYCPLCNSAVAFKRRAAGQLLDFGTSGALYHSALVMYDRQTETLWTHFDGRAVVGTLVGEELEFIPVSTVAWRDARRAHPTAQVLTRETGYARQYGRNPYPRYDQSDKPLTGFFSGTVDPRLPPMDRVVGVQASDHSAAVATERVAANGVVELSVGGEPVTVWHLPGAVSPIHKATVAGGSDVGATGAFRAVHRGQRLHFSRAGRNFVDAETRSSWNILGEAVEGPLAGERLDRVTHVDTFWFAWSSYHPATSLDN